ncbi:MAG: hypothetical protein U0869_21650 [Chloroflexota bacterium]
MTFDERLEDAITAGLADLAGSGGTVDIEAILTRSSQTRQRSARFPFQRSDLPSAAPGGAMGGLAGRLHPMMPTIRLAAVATLALALGAALPSLLGGSPTVPSPSAGPSASAEPVRWATGTIALANSCRDPRTAIVKGVSITGRGYRCEPQVWTTDDPRLSGTGAVTWNFDTYQTDSGRATLNVATTELHNEGGDWSCDSTPITTTGPVLQGLQVLPVDLLCTGSGGYDGLKAVVHVDLSTVPYPISAVILAGDLPPAP